MRIWKKVIIFVCFFMLLTPTVFAANSWKEVANEIEAILEEAVTFYANGDIEAGKDKVDNAYFGPYEGKQMENAVRLKISGKDNAEIEFLFRNIKKLMTNGASVEEVNNAKRETVEKIFGAANQLDGENKSAWGAFVASLLIIFREGFEAILLIGALIAYLIKSGNKEKVLLIYWSALVALVLSIATAIAISFVFAISGASLEILEGVTMLIAVAVLFSVSYWLISKAEADKWQQYIEGKMAAALTTGNKFALGFAAFLAVYREGAETILFYQALLSSSQPEDIGMITFGFVVGCILLVGLYVIIRYWGIRIPLKPFFIATSMLLYYLAFVFAGDGINELQAGNFISNTYINFPTITFLGIYPTVESLLVQSLLIIALIVGLGIQKYNSKKLANKQNIGG